MVNRFTGEDYRKLVNPSPLPAHNLWISTQAPRSQLQFLAVIFPYRDTDPTPSIEGVGDDAVRATSGRQSDLITFSPDRSREADFYINVAAINANSRP